MMRASPRFPTALVSHKPKACEMPDLKGATAYLLKAGIKEFSDALSPDAGDLEAHDLPGGLGMEARLYVQSIPSRAPGWVPFLEEGFEIALPDLRTRQASAVLLVRVTGRLVAFAFGLGRHLLDRRALVRDFGLRAALNVIDADEIRSFDARAYQDVVLLTRRQASRGTSVEGLGIESRRDLIRSVTGAPLDDAFGSRVTGSDSLGLTATMSLSDLATKARQMIALYAADAYLDRFGWIDRLQPISDDVRIADLDAALIAALNSPEPTRLAYLAEPEIVDFTRLGGYRYTGQRRDEVQNGLDLQAYLDVLDSEVTLEAIRRQHIELIGLDTGQRVDQWTVYDALVFELPQDGSLYVLSEGTWHLVAGDYLQQIDDRIRDIAISTLDLPDADPGEWERAYCLRAAAGRDDRVALDRQLARFPTERGRVEACDLFTASHEFVHLKRGMTASAMSHLFLQGVVSAELFRESPAFRQQVAGHLRPTHPAIADLIPAGKPDRDVFEVVYAVMTDEPDRIPSRLPFFSRLTLARAADILEALDYRVSVRAVPRPDAILHRPARGAAAG